MAPVEPAQKAEVIAFLQALDGKIHHRTELYIIGGAAVTLAYAPENRTSDIDVVQATDEVVQFGGTASDLSREFGVYISPLAEITFSAPAGWKARCEVHELGTKNLTIKIADRYDLILGKIARLEQRDIEDIQAINLNAGIDPDALIARLNDNLREIKNSAGYRSNAQMLFEILSRPIEFKGGKALFV